MPPLGDWIYSACFDASGMLVIGGAWTGEIQVFSTDTAEPLWQFDTNPDLTEEATGHTTEALSAGGDALDIARSQPSTEVVLTRN